MRRRATVLVFGLLGAGCFVERWAKPGGTRADYERDRVACEQEATLVGPVVHEADFNACMERRGYHRR